MFTIFSGSGILDSGGEVLKRQIHFVSALVLSLFFLSVPSAQAASCSTSDSSRAAELVVESQELSDTSGYCLLEGSEVPVEELVPTVNCLEWVLEIPYTEDAQNVSFVDTISESGASWEFDCANIFAYTDSENLIGLSYGETGTAETTKAVSTDFSCDADSVSGSFDISAMSSGEVLYVYLGAIADTSFGDGSELSVYNNIASITVDGETTTVIQDINYNVTEYSAATKDGMEQFLKTKKGLSGKSVAKSAKSLDPTMLGMMMQTPNGGFTRYMNAGDRYVVYRVDSKSGRAQLDYESAKPAIIGRWKQEQQGKALQDYFNKMRSKADIEIIRQ